jgi:hypothetical protein
VCRVICCGISYVFQNFNPLVCRATTNKKLKETVALELSFVNSNLQLLKEQLAELNSSVEVYQVCILRVNIRRQLWS